MLNKMLAGLVLAVLAWPAFGQAPTVTLNASPLSGVSPLTVTLTWSSTGATSCLAQDGWSGNKATSGSQVITGVSATTTYTLTCSAGDGSVEVNWTPPTQNTDGSPLQDLTGYKLYHATTSAGLASASPIILPPSSTYTINNLPAGPLYVGLKATNAQGIDSVMSNVANINVLVPSDADSVTVTVGTQPNPPTIVTIQTLVYDLGPNGGIQKLVGSIALGVPCGQFIKRKNGKDYHEVPLDQVDLDRMPKSAIVVAVCGVPA